MNSSTGGLLDVDPAKQWEWHEAYRDSFRNQYRTTYTDMSHGRETYARSDYPSGYGGHIPSLRFDVLFRNTAFDRNQVLKRSDPSRDAHPSFKDQLEGVPTFCAKPQGAKKNPSYKVVPHDGTTTNIRAPWGVLKPVVALPNFRNVPSTMTRARSMPSITGSSGRLDRPNRAAQNVAVSMATPKNQSAVPDETLAMQATNNYSGNSDPLKHTVSMANQAAQRQVMPSEQQMLMEEVMGQ
jgi:hypothetical protein